MVFCCICCILPGSFLTLSISLRLCFLLWFLFLCDSLSCIQDPVFPGLLNVAFPPLIIFLSTCFLSSARSLPSWHLKFLPGVFLLALGVAAPIGLCLDWPLTADSSVGFLTPQCSRELRSWFWHSSCIFGVCRLGLSPCLLKMELLS